MVTLLVRAVLALFSVPVQLSTAHPEAGAAVRVIISPATKEPTGQVDEFNGEAVGSVPPVPVWVRVRV
jgi:hypothetical protein